MTIQNISSPELLNNLDRPDIAIVDIRPAEAYNGWRLQGEPRGGHIPGAVSFPRVWLDRFSTSQLKSLLMSKNLTSKKAVILYGYKNDHRLAMMDFLAANGIQDIFLYQGGQQDWAADASLPLESLANYHKLVYPEWVRDLQAGVDIQHPPEPDCNLFEVGWENLEEYKGGHIPGALYFDLSRLEDPRTWNILPFAEVCAYLTALGISHDSTCILYGRDSMATARAACILMYAGVEDVRVLDGGFDSWVNAGYPLETGINQPVPVQSFGLTTPGHPEYILGMDAVKAFCQNKDGLLVSVRSWAEYIGETSGYDFIQPKGRIPGAVWGYSGSDPQQMQDYRSPDNSMRPYREIAENWHNSGITSDKKIIFYCGTGWRASEAFFYAHLMGWLQIGVYDGGWFEWSRDGSNPTESGIPGQ